MTKKELALGTVNLSDIAREVVADLRSKDPDRNVNVSIADNVVAKGDNGLIKQVLGYLMENAWKFTRKVKDAKIEFGTMVKGKDNVYFVKDNGAGFDNKYSDKLFSAFQRLHTEEEFAGPGLGLYTAKKIIEKHGGDIWAEAEEDKGAAFYFTINV
jgi:light-regulated signal transduction histidine kinase (bacteriophytochrome)